MAHQHRIVKCVCGNVLLQCRCADLNKLVVTQTDPCECSTPYAPPIISDKRLHLKRPEIHLPDQAPTRPESHVASDGLPPDPALAGPDSVAPKPLDPKTGQYGAYWVLNAEERAKGFVRPVRDRYKHVGIRPKFPLRDLTPNEMREHASQGYVKYEHYLEPQGAAIGRYWTAEELESGCGTLTRMGRAIAETYAREPTFYQSTFCYHCGKHRPVAEFVWVDGEEKVTTEILGS